jgi:hypothetical protein
MAVRVQLRVHLLLLLLQLMRVDEGQTVRKIYKERGKRE